MWVYKITLLSLLIFGPRVFAADSEEAKAIHVKVEILDLAHDVCRYYDRYVQSTLSLKELIEKERLLSMQAEGGSLETLGNNREMVLDEHVYCGDDRPNLQDSIQKYVNTVLYLEYGAKQTFMQVTIEDRVNNRRLKCERTVAANLLLKDFIKQEQELCMQAEGGDIEKLRATRILELDRVYDLNLNISMRNFDGSEIFLDYWDTAKTGEVEYHANE